MALQRPEANQPLPTTTLPRPPPQGRDLSSAAPALDSDTWPEAARRYLAAAAAARYLSTSEPRSAALKSLGLRGQLANVEPAVGGRGASGGGGVYYTSPAQTKPRQGSISTQGGTMILLRGAEGVEEEARGWGPAREGATGDQIFVDACCGCCFIWHGRLAPGTHVSCATAIRATPHPPAAFLSLDA